MVTASTLDALWTTLWVDGHGGPLTTLHTSWSRRVLWRLVRRGRHRLLSTTGPIVVTSTVLVWALLMWGGWVLLFSADPLSLLHSRSGTPASTMERVYFTGYTLFTLGNGDFAPQGPWWSSATAVASLSGLFLITLAVTYLVFSQRRRAEAVLREPDRCAGEHRGRVRRPLLPRGETVPVGSKKSGDPRRCAHLVEPGRPARPAAAPSALHCARESVRLFLATIRGAFVSASGTSPPALTLAGLRAAGIPTVSDEQFSACIAELDQRRRLIQGFLEGEGRAWPGSDSSDGFR